MYQHERNGREQGDGGAADQGAAGKRTRTQGLTGGGAAGGNTPVTQPVTPSANSHDDPFDFSFGSDDYEAAYASLSSTAQSLVDQQAETFHDADLTDLTWSTLEQALGKPRAWLDGFLKWTYRRTHPTHATHKATNTAPVGVLDRTGDCHYEGTANVDEHGHKEYKGTFKGSRFPDVKYRNDLKVELNQTMRDEYLVTLDKELPDAPRGIKLLMTVMTKMEGFSKSSKSHQTHNPGNIGNTDNGSKHVLDDLGDGIRLQYDYLCRVAGGHHPRYEIGKKIDLAPYYSKEIANHPSYGKSPYVPGYEFEYSGQLDQFIKIYSTGARAGNNYINTIVSYFKQNGIDITPETTLADIIAIE